MDAAKRRREAERLFCTVAVLMSFCLTPCSRAAASLSPGEYRGPVDGDGQDYTTKVDGNQLESISTREDKGLVSGKDLAYAKLDENRRDSFDGNEELTIDDGGSGAVGEGPFLATDVPLTQTPTSVYSEEDEGYTEEGGNSSSAAEPPLCPQFCCTTNMSCFYILSNATRKPEVECSCDGFSADKNCVIQNKTTFWEELVESEETSRGICIEFHMKNALNETGYKINCHIEGVHDFTFTTVHWERQFSSTDRPTVTPHQELWLQYRPCVLYIEVNSTKPPVPVGLNKTVQLVMQYIGTGLCFVFIGIIMTSCKEVKLGT
uniref:EGF-like domain-containing protein n=1 Tax=Branchiostoma floridae TaxID=7739 RepID=C3ZK27_BRAFL|eukprot:XP_002591114.1 hypothetical protein BRAFLDRAFT_109627 [Branchiostoma floridae]